MTDSSPSTGNRAVSIGGNASGNVIQTGDRNTASVQLQLVKLPPPDSVDIRAELTALRAALARLDSPDRRKIENALDDAEDELTKAKPNKDEIGKALDRALDYAKRAEGFAKVIETLKPHLTSAAAWLGSNWHTILAAVGFSA